MYRYANTAIFPADGGRKGREDDGFKEKDFARATNDTFIRATDKIANHPNV